MIQNGQKQAPPNYGTDFNCYDKCQKLGMKISEEFLLEHGGYDSGHHKTTLQIIAEANQKRGRNVSFKGGVPHLYNFL